MSRFLKRPPRGYFVQCGCHNCKHVFVEYEYDEAPRYYCTFRAPPRPKCGSVAMGDAEEWPSSAVGFAWDRAYRAWSKWAKGRVVDAAGFCPKGDWKETQK